VHFGFYQTSPVVVALLFPLLVSYVPTGLAGCVSHRIAFMLPLPLAGIFSWRDDRFRPTLGNRVMTLFCVIRSVACHAVYRFIFWDLTQQLRQHGRIPDAVVRHFQSVREMG
jgi:hypothetical protein